MTKAWYTVREFAELIGWPRRTVRYYLKSKLILARPKTKERGEWRIPRKELIKWGLLEEDEIS